MAEVERWSRLTRAIVPVLEKIASHPMLDDERDLLEVLIEEHGLDGESPPEWMVGFFDDVLNQRVDGPRRFVPMEYPEGENALSNILLDIQAEIMPLGYDDYGEGAEWPIPNCGVRVYISRENIDSSTSSVEVQSYDSP